MVAALAAPAIAVEMSQERDERGRWSREDSTLRLVDAARPPLGSARPPRDGRVGDAGFEPPSRSSDPNIGI